MDETKLVWERKEEEAFLPSSYFLRSVLSFSTAMRASKLHHRRAKDASVLTILEKGTKIVSSSVEFPLRLTQSEVGSLASASICDLAKVRALLGSSVAPCYQTSCAGCRARGELTADR